MTARMLYLRFVYVVNIFSTLNLNLVLNVTRSTTPVYTSRLIKSEKILYLRVFGHVT